MGQLQTTSVVSGYEGVPANINLPSPISVPDDKIRRRLTEKKSGKEFQDRRREDWNDNYDLNRNKVIVNRLTQRQTVNIPLMKETIKTLLSKIDDAPNVEWKEKSGDQYKEILVQEMWNGDSDRLNFEAIDIQDKKTVLLYGRSFKKLNLDSEGLDVRALDIYDTLVDPLTDPLDLETARFVIHQNIFRSVDEILNDERYEQKAKDNLKNYIYGKKEGIAQSDKNRSEWEKKMERLKDMGFDQSKFPLFAGGDVIVNLTEHYYNEWNKTENKWERRVMVYANEYVELMDEKLLDLIGVEFYPFVTWGDDVETQDFWSDSVADLVRTPNKIINVWFSQLVENRTIRNFQMHWYVPSQGYTAQTYEAGPGRMMPSPPLQPGQSIKDVIMPVEVSGLDETMGAIDFVTKIVDRASSSSQVDKGIAQQKGMNKQMVQALLAKAQERTNAMIKFYRRSWKDLAMKWIAIMEKNQSGKMTLHKIARNGKVWPKSIYPSDWKSKFGFIAQVRSSSEAESEKQKGIQKFMFLLQQFPNNFALKKIAQKRMLAMVDLTPEEIREIDETEKKLIEAQQKMPQAGQPQADQGQSTQPNQPQPPNQNANMNPDLVNQVQRKLKQLQALNA